MLNRQFLKMIVARYNNRSQARRHRRYKQVNIRQTPPRFNNLCPKFRRY